MALPRLTTHASRFTSIAAVLLSICALTLAFVGLFEWDVPLTRFIRSLNDFHMDHLANPWLAQLSDIGDRMGKGESLVILSLGLLAVGYGLKHESGKPPAGRVSLARTCRVAHQQSRQACDRPAPPKIHACGESRVLPGSGSGWDSFPSGHATAAFAVATVLAAKFPRWRWAILPLAIAIAASRIVRGSHFLTDVAGGAAIGYAVGSVVARPWREWRASLESALFEMTPLLAALIAVVWTIGHQPSDAWPVAQWIGAGMFFTMLGLAGHVLLAVQAGKAPTWLSMSMTQGLIGLGLGMTTGSLWVTATVLCVCLAHWLRSYQDVEAASAIKTARYGLLLKEAVFVLAVLLMLLLVADLRGALPRL